MRYSLVLTMFLTTALFLSACDESSSAASSADSAAPKAGDELPVASETAPSPENSLATPESSMDEGSPAGEAVTDQELPPAADIPPPPNREVFSDAACDFEAWVGQPADEAAVKATGRPYRLLKPDSMMTMDHNPDRINVVHGEDGKVTRIWCG